MKRPAKINASAPQIRFAFSLASERGWATNLAEATVTDPQGNTYLFNQVERGTCSLAKASAFIDALKALPRPAPVQAQTPKVQRTEIEDGIEVVGEGFTCGPICCAIVEGTVTVVSDYEL